MCFLIGFIFIACEEKKAVDSNFVYTGPNMISENLSIAYSDSGRVTVKMSTAEMRRLQNNDELYPKAIYVTFLDKNGVEYSSLRGDSARKENALNRYLIMGNVFFYNRQQQQSLSTEELIWDPNKRIVFTNKKVAVNTPTDRIEGRGMEAAQDFSNYKFTGGVTGYFQVDSLITQADTLKK